MPGRGSVVPVVARRESGRFRATNNPNKPRKRMFKTLIKSGNYSEYRCESSSQTRLTIVRITLNDNDVLLEHCSQRSLKMNEKDATSAEKTHHQQTAFEHAEKRVVDPTKST